MNSTELVTFEKGEARTTSIVIAEGVRLDHASVIKLVRKYSDYLEKLGQVRFEIRLNAQGRATEFATLNEPQSTYLITLMKNTPIVCEFKLELVRAFFELRDMVRTGSIADKRVDVNMNHTRGITNPHGLDIKFTFNLAQKPNRASLVMFEHLTGIDMGEVINHLSEAGVTSPASLNLAAFVKARVRESSRGNIAKSTIYAAYIAWCEEKGASFLSPSVFGRGLLQHFPAITNGKSGGTPRVNTYLGIELLTEVAE
jgi:phage regulator Rha-like protein